jgi:hypothetical protein
MRVRLMSEETVAVEPQPLYESSESDGNIPYDLIQNAVATTLLRGIRRSRPSRDLILSNGEIDVRESRHFIPVPKRLTRSETNSLRPSIEAADIVQEVIARCLATNDFTPQNVWRTTYRVVMDEVRHPVGISGTTKTAIDLVDLDKVDSESESDGEIEAVIESRILYEYMIRLTPAERRAVSRKLEGMPLNSADRDALKRARRRLDRMTIYVA